MTLLHSVRVNGHVAAAAALEAIDLLSQSMPETTRDFAITELVRCFSVTASKDDEPFQLKAQLAALADELIRFPADAVKGACRDWANKNKWRPTLFDLVESCERRSQVRMKTMQALRSSL